ncbi:hypothetical protein LOAG_08315 [Loa loa]|uniref:Uncharacterized protein n=2 Tax=Loa loa TaxID=7209 RepID=A0A1S0TTU3_LOALO|nr:hypothetical protein LOAG_08315 [Loa loa]EFO20173.1 hypothetical protein LOAG_08315 [Loa loa]
MTAICAHPSQYHHYFYLGCDSVQQSYLVTVHSTAVHSYLQWCYCMYETGKVDSCDNGDDNSVVALPVEETMMLAGMGLKSIGAFCCFEGVALVVAKNSAFLLNVYFRAARTAVRSWGGDSGPNIPSVPWIMVASQKRAVTASGVRVTSGSSDLGP